MELSPSLTGWRRSHQSPARSVGFASTASKRLGHELRRPEGDYLRDGIYELRAKHAGVNYRMLYFFHGRVAAVVSHGLSKQQAMVPPMDIENALQRKARFAANPRRHTFVPPQED